MTFRTISLLFISTLLTGILLLQWWSIKSFTNNVAQQIGESAFEVSQATAQKLIFDNPKKIRLHSTVLNQQSKMSQHKLEKILTRISQDISIELIDKQKDNFILLNADNTEYQIPIPRTGIHRALEDFSDKVLYSTLILLSIGILLAVLFTHKLTRPLNALKSVATKIGQGEFGIKVNQQKGWQPKELELMIASFNNMSEQIYTLNVQNEDLRNKAHLSELVEISRGIAHTIRNPLNTLSLAIDELKEQHSEQRKFELINIAKIQIKRIDSWIKSLMDIMNNDDNLSQKLTINFLIDSIILELSHANQHNIKIFHHTTPHTLVLQGVENEMKGVIQNILANSIEASSKESEINIYSSIQGEMVKIIVDDNGKGISEKIYSKLYTPHNTDKTFGSGMGLYLAKRIIKYKYQGSLELSNKPEGGVKATLLLSSRVL